MADVGDISLLVKTTSDKRVLKKRKKTPTKRKHTLWLTVTKMK